MRCQRCGKSISPLRQLTDQEFCSQHCRTKGPRASASPLHEIDFHDEWVAAPGQAARKTASKSGASLGVVLLAVVALMVAGRMWYGGGGGPMGPAAGTVLDPTAPGGAVASQRSLGGVVDWLHDRMPGDKPLRIRTEFAKGLSGWGRETSWRVENGLARPGRLRLWQPTMGKTDYDVDFLGQIDQRAISWAFRAENEREYYASKIVLHRPGEISGASIHRYIIQRSQTVSKIELPLPVILQRNRPYQFTVAVKGNRFRTLIDGHVIDEWSDNRHQSGGVGFYSDAGEVAGLHWVNFRERRGILGQLMAMAFILPPGMEF